MIYITIISKSCSLKANISLGITSPGNRHSGIPVIVSVCDRLDFIYTMLHYPRLCGDFSISGELPEQDLKNCYSSLFVKVVFCLFLYFVYSYIICMITKKKFRDFLFSIITNH